MDLFACTELLAYRTRNTVHHQAEAIHPVSIHDIRRVSSDNILQGLCHSLQSQDVQVSNVAKHESQNHRMALYIKVCVGRVALYSFLPGCSSLGVPCECILASEEENLQRTKKQLASEASLLKLRVTFWKRPSRMARSEASWKVRNLADVRAVRGRDSFMLMLEVR